MQTPEKKVYKYKVISSPKNPYVCKCYECGSTEAGDPEENYTENYDNYDEGDIWLCDECYLGEP